VGSRANLRERRGGVRCPLVHWVQLQSTAMVRLSPMTPRSDPQAGRRAGRDMQMRLERGYDLRAVFT
jgi:hypothetical protein